MQVQRVPLALGVIVGAAVVMAIGFIIWWAFPGTTQMPQRLVSTPQVQRGQAIYAANCASCHGGPAGGSMMDYPPKHNASGHTWHHPDCELVEVITTGTGPMTEMMRKMMAPPGAPTMPAWREKLSADEIDAVLAYIKTMWTPEQRELQERATRQRC